MMRDTIRPGSFFAALLLIILAPLLALLALLVLVAQGRPVLFRQLRAGREGKAFTMMKFRSMRDLRDAEGHLLPDAARTTAIGHFLRRSRLDELPELWNIVVGEMAWVGPRPLLPQTIEEMGAEGRLRCSVRPGLTGWAQVNGNTLLSLHEKLELDLWYVKNRTLRIDLLTLLYTVGVILRGEKINRTELEKALAGRHHRSS